MYNTIGGLLTPSPLYKMLYESIAQLVHPWALSRSLSPSLSLPLSLSLSLSLSLVCENIFIGLNVLGTMRGWRSPKVSAV